MRFKAKIALSKCNIFYTTVKLRTLKPGFVMGLRPGPLVWMRTHYLLQNIRTGGNVVRVHLFELLDSSEQKWGVAGERKRYPIYYKSKASLFYLYLLSGGICAPEDTEAAVPSTVYSKYLYLQHNYGMSVYVKHDVKRLKISKLMACLGKIPF